VTLRAITGGTTPDLGLADYLWARPKKGGKFSFGHRLIVFQAFPPTEDEGGLFVPMLPYIDDGDYLISPAHYLVNPSRKGPSLIVLCEVRDYKDKRISPRSQLMTLRDKGAWRVDDGLRWAFRQGYSLIGNLNDRILDEHMQWCLDAGLCIYLGGNHGPFDASFGQFQVGIRGFDSVYEPEDITPSLLACDHLWIARWALERIVHRHGLGIQWASDFTILSTATEGELQEAFPDKTTWTPRTSLLPHRPSYVEVQGFDAMADPYDIVRKYLLWATGIVPSEEG
jgi:hypothetical protein